MPLLGDPVYGNGATKGAPRTMLHAAALTVLRDGKPPVSATAPLPADFTALGFADDHGTLNGTHRRHAFDIAEEKFIASSGPGVEQNVNKVATAVQLRVNVFRLACRPKRSSD